MVPDAVLMDTQEELTDLLDRKAFVARLIDVVEILSENRKNASFAVNGAWGVGKTFVLNRFEEEIAKYPLEEDGPRKYLVFHYDCWKYDYYEEPLIALVAALTDSIDKQTNFISADKRTTFKVVLKEIIAGLVEVGSVKTGFDIKKIFETIKSARNKATQEIADSHDFDVYFSFNCILEKLRAAIKDLAEEQTILLVVDELDRCLPEYTITVLERLHHVLEGIPNVQTIISIDKEQLECTVRQIYGCNTNAKRYLEKFISFEITLREGSLEARADPLFERYYGKVFELLSAEKTIVAIITGSLPNSELGQIIKECNAGIVYEQANGTEEYTQFKLKLFSLVKQKKMMGRIRSNIDRDMRDKYAYQNIAKQLEELFETT